MSILGRIHSLRVVLSACCLLLCMANACAEPRIYLYTEEYPPMNFTRNGKPAGLAVDVVQELARRIHVPVSIFVVPWARGFRLAQLQTNTGLFSTMRTEQRERIFKWVGPLTTTTSSFYALSRKKLTLKTLDDARKARAITVPLDWASYQTLLSAGFQNLEPVNDPKLMIKLLKSGRVDFMVTDQQNLPALLAAEGADPGLVTAVLPFMRNSTYIAFSRDTADDIVSVWQNALDQMKLDGAFKAIYKKWLPNDKPPGLMQDPDLSPLQEMTAENRPR
nr:transporter substrate-binding domain-containing protein [Leeia oryzae]